jgi:hypothetical protein
MEPKLKKQKIFAIVENSAQPMTINGVGGGPQADGKAGEGRVVVEYEKEFDRDETLQHALEKFHDCQMNSVRNFGCVGQNEQRDAAGEEEDPDEIRQFFLTKMEKSLIEFHGTNRVIQLLKNKDHLNLLTCTRPSNPIKGALLPANQRIHLRQLGFHESHEYLQSSLAKATELVQQRRRFSTECLELRKKWRLIWSPTAATGTGGGGRGNSATFLSHRDEIAIDCSYLTAGDMTLVNKHTVPLPVRSSGFLLPSAAAAPSPHRPSQDFFTLELSLSHVTSGDFYSQTLWNILYSNRNPLRDSYCPASPSASPIPIPTTEFISWQCQITQHDVSIRSFFASLVAIERESRLLNAESVLYDIWNTTSSSKASSSESSTLWETLLQESFTQPLHIVSHTRSQIVLSLSPSLQLTLSQVPLFVPLTDSDLEELAASSSSCIPEDQIPLLSLLTPSRQSPHLNASPFPSDSFATMIGCAALSMEFILLTAHRHQHSISTNTPISSALGPLAQSPQTITPSSCLIASYTPLSHEWNWNTFLTQQPPHKSKQIPKSHHTYRAVLLRLKEICQAHLLFQRFIRSVSSFAPVVSTSPQLSTPFHSSPVAIEIPSRGLSFTLLPITSPNYFLTTQFLFHVTVAAGSWKHHPNPHFLRLQILPSSLQVDDITSLNSPDRPIPFGAVSSSSPSFPGSDAGPILSFRTDELLIPSSCRVMRTPQGSNPQSGVHHFEDSCGLLWEYFLSHTTA